LSTIPLRSGPAGFDRVDDFRKLVGAGIESLFALPTAVELAFGDESGVLGGAEDPVENLVDVLFDLAQRGTVVVSAGLRDDLQERSLVTRRVEEDAPVATYYALTEKGESFEPVFEQIGEWADEWLDDSLVTPSS
jgi:hypothetical protein